MPVLDAPLDAASPAFARAAKQAAARSRELLELLEQARAGGGQDARERHRARGKLTAHERVELLADPGSASLELSPLAAHGLYGGAVPGAGIVCALVQIAARWCVAIANDATVKGGTYFPVSVRKHIRAQEIAAANHLPCIYLVDSGGAHLPLQHEMFADRDHGGRFFHNQARMSARGIPQIACVMGSCTAGGAYVPAMCDESVIVRGTGTIFLGGPPLVKAATGEVVTAEELGGADVHARVSGLVDYVADSDEQAIALVRGLVGNLPYAPPRMPWQRRAARAPAHDAGELAGLAAAAQGTFPAHAVLARLLDGGALHEFKAAYGGALVCGFGHLEGTPLGVVVSAAPLTGDAARKGAHFVQLCCRRRIPLLFVQGTAELDAVHDRRGLAKDMAKLASTVACARIPIFTVIARDGAGPAALALGSRASDPRLIVSWPGARVSSPADATASEPADALHATARVWDDGVVDPADTREVLSIALAAACEAPVERTRFGVVRM